MDEAELCHCDEPKLYDSIGDPYCLICEGLVPLEIDEVGDRVHNIEVAQSATPRRPVVVHRGSFGDFTHVGRDRCRCRPQVLRPKVAS